MSIKIEMNWYLVVKDNNDIKDCCNKKCYKIETDNTSIYPINSIVPLIFENENRCVGLVKVKEITVNERGSVVIFELIKSFDKYYNIAKHYYSMYKFSKEDLKTLPI